MGYAGGDADTIDGVARGHLRKKKKKKDSTDISMRTISEL